MALIKQIKVGGTTYDIGVVVGSGLRFNSGLELVLSGGLGFSQRGEVVIEASSGVRVDNSGLSVLISGHDTGYKYGLEYKHNTVALKLASGLKFNDMGYIQLDLGAGLSQDSEGKIVTT